jgi:integrase
VLLSEDGTGLIRVVEGKSKAARRMLPMTPKARSLLKARHEEQGSPSEGWVFPSNSKTGHLTGDGTKEQHTRAVRDSNVEAFVPYVLRHTALTRLGGAAGGDVFALARVAGHSSITITQRDVHPQADTIGGIFAKAFELSGVKQKSLGVATKSATLKNSKKPLFLDRESKLPLN